MSRKRFYRAAPLPACVLFPMLQRPDAHMTEPISPRFPNESSLVFDELVRTHYGRLCNFAYRFVGSRDVAEDIVQDVLARLWRNREEFDPRDPLAYLYQAVRNQAVSYRRQQGVRERWSAHAADEIERRPGEDGLSRVEAADLATALARAVDQLPERCRLIFTMSREQGLSYAEIAKILGISIKTVETQMGRALKALRSRLAGYLALALTVASVGRHLA
jgi:RNA polymerase sigma-19 factor, ECF subfamily